MEEIMVSIICNTYNHEKYIANAIDSFLMQKTDFEYEILIHDDASTDKTADIIREYERKYLGIIKPIYQKENKLSQGISVGKINRERAIGKYFAICEGDDYWIDSHKLQKQVEFLEMNFEFSACVHAAITVNSETGKKISEIRPSIYNKEFSMEEIIEGGGGFVATNSIVYRRDIGNLRPSFYYKNKYSFGDYQLMILLALVGKVYYLNEYMSAYRHNVPGSWSYRIRLDPTKASENMREIIDMLNEVNEETNYVYDSIIQRTNQNTKFSLILHECNLKEAKQSYLEIITIN